MKRINHSFAFSDDGACTNQAENFFSRLRRVEDGNQLRRVGMGALAFGKSRKGYWQRAAA